MATNVADQVTEFGVLRTKFARVEDPEAGRLRLAELTYILDRPIPTQVCLTEEVQKMRPEEVREARRVLGMTQQALADRLGVTINAVQRWEAGTRPPSGPVIVAIRLLVANVKPVPARTA